MLGPLRVDVDAYVPRENPYSFQGTAGPWDEQELQLAFAKANVIEVGAANNVRITTLLSLGPGGAPGVMSPMGGFPDIMPPSGEVLTLRVTKVGILNRKDDVLEGGKKSSNRKWKPWSVILTGSQLLLFRDPAWAAGLLSQVDSPDAQFVFPQTVFKPDELLSVKDAIAVFDRSYTKVFCTTLSTCNYLMKLVRKRIPLCDARWPPVLATIFLGARTQRMDISDQLCQYF
jgi:hypothetical protein